MSIAVDELEIDVVQDVETGAPLRDHVLRVLQDHFEQLGNETPRHLHKMVMREVEEPLLEITIAYCAGNQSRAAKILGLSRGTFRKKLSTYGML